MQCSTVARSRGLKPGSYNSVGRRKQTHPDGTKYGTGKHTQTKQSTVLVPIVRENFPYTAELENWTLVIETSN